MKKLLPLFLISLFVVPLLAQGHGPAALNEVQTRDQMMDYLGDRVMGEDQHEEMENLMFQMMEGSLDSQEADRLLNLMEQYPGPHGMMMNEMMWGDESPMQWRDMSNGMWGMNYGFTSWWSVLAWLVLICTLVWLIVGVMIIVFLSKKMGFGSEKKEE